MKRILTIIIALSYSSGIYAQLDGSVGIKFKPVSGDYNLIRSYNSEYEDLTFDTRYPLVFSTISTGAFEFVNHLGTELFAIKGIDGTTFFKGNVGIGTVLPQAQLEIVSNAAFTAHEGNSFVIRSSNSSSPNDSRILGMTITLDGPSNVSSSSQKSVGLFAQSSGSWSNNVDMLFYTRGSSQAPYFSEKMRIRSNGNVGIGTETPQSKLAVNGQIRATEVKVLSDITVPDYVFESDYELRTLKETKKYIYVNKHLPEIPSAAEIGENGIDLGDMNMRLLKKIEELTLYLIEQSEEIHKLKKEVTTLKNK